VVTVGVILGLLFAVSLLRRRRRGRGPDLHEFGDAVGRRDPITGGRHTWKV
jgi:hypothetical protein